MVDLEKIENYFSQQSEKSEEDEKMILSHLWEEKRRLVNQFLEDYSSILEGFWYKGNSCFKMEFKKFAAMDKSNDAKKEYSSFSEKEILNMGQQAELFYDDNFVIAAYHEMLSPNYDAFISKEYTSDNLIVIRDHLWALSIFYNHMPEIFIDKPISIVLFYKIEIATLKLIAIANQIMAKLYIEGKYFDSEQIRHESIRRGKGTLEKKRKILEAYNSIPESQKKTSKHGLANRIRDLLLKTYQETEVPSIDTIKRNLKNEKLPPFC